MTPPETPRRWTVHVCPKCGQQGADGEACVHGSGPPEDRRWLTYWLEPVDVVEASLLREAITALERTIPFLGTFPMSVESQAEIEAVLARLHRENTE